MKYEKGHARVEGSAVLLHRIELSPHLLEPGPPEVLKCHNVAVDAQGSTGNHRSILHQSTYRGRNRANEKESDTQFSDWPHKQNLFNLSKRQDLTDSWRHPRPFGVEIPLGVGAVTQLGKEYWPITVRDSFFWGVVGQQSDNCIPHYFLQ